MSCLIRLHSDLPVFIVNTFGHYCENIKDKVEGAVVMSVLQSTQKLENTTLSYSAHAA